ncbi:hypothetical protein FB451DRAFT_1568798, partial [Mycena latifolia]
MAKTSLLASESSSVIFPRLRYDTATLAFHGSPGASYSAAPVDSTSIEYDRVLCACPRLSSPLLAPLSVQILWDTTWTKPPQVSSCSISGAFHFAAWSRIGCQAAGGRSTTANASCASPGPDRRLRACASSPALHHAVSDAGPPLRAPPNGTFSRDRASTTCREPASSLRRCGLCPHCTRRHRGVLRGNARRWSRGVGYVGAM